MDSKGCTNVMKVKSIERKCVVWMTRPKKSGSMDKKLECLALGTRRGEDPRCQIGGASKKNVPFFYFFATPLTLGGLSFLAGFIPLR